MTREDYVVFDMDGQNCAVPLGSVRRIVRAAALSPVPDASTGLLGLLNLHGRLVPVYDVRISLGYPSKPLSAADRFLIVDNGIGAAGIRANEIRHIGKVEAESPAQCRRILGQNRLFCGVGQWEGKTVLLMDPASLGKKADLSAKTVKESDGQVIDLTLGQVDAVHDRETAETWG